MYLIIKNTLDSHLVDLRFPVGLLFLVDLLYLEVPLYLVDLRSQVAQ